jgi:hypothetical protein
MLNDSFIGDAQGADEGHSTIQGALEWYVRSDLYKEHYSFLIDIFKDYKKAMLTEIASEDDPDVIMNASSHILVAESILGDVLLRSFRTALHCKVFNGIAVNGPKVAGLLAYWIIKRQPFSPDYGRGMFSDADSPYFGRFDDVNEQIAAHIILSMFRERVEDDSGINYKPYKEKMIHNLRYRDQTEDSMMLLSESIGREAFELAVAEYDDRGPVSSLRQDE